MLIRDELRLPCLDILPDVLGGVNLVLQALPLFLEIIIILMDIIIKPLNFIKQALFLETNGLTFSGQSLQFPLLIILKCS